MTNSLNRSLSQKQLADGTIETAKTFSSPKSIHRQVNPPQMQIQNGANSSAEKHCLHPVRRYVERAHRARSGGHIRYRLPTHPPKQECRKTDFKWNRDAYTVQSAYTMFLSSFGATRQEKRYILNRFRFPQFCCWLSMPMASWINRPTQGIRQNYGKALQK